MHICLDIDDTITYQPEFFAKLTHDFAEAKITVVTFRTDYQDAEKCLKQNHIRYDTLIVSTDPTLGKGGDEPLHIWKSNLINQMKPDMLFEDMPEVVALIDDEIAVFQPCDSVIRSWLRSQISRP